MEAALLDQLAAIVQGVTILSPHSFRVADHQVKVATPPRADPPEESMPPLLAELQQHLYWCGYCTRFPGPLPDAPGDAAAAFVQSLADANQSQDRYDPGWRIEGILPSGQVVVRRDSLACTLWPGEFLTLEGPGRAPTLGATVIVFLPRESHTRQPGFYFAFGETPADSIADAYALRFYWNIRATGAALLLRLLTAALNRFDIPFCFKCLAHPAYYYRRDPAVLYIGARFYQVASVLLADVWRKVQVELEDDVPLFTRRLAPGLAFAEDPGPQESFGQSRCRMLAAALWQAYVTGYENSAASLDFVVEHLTHQGLRLEEPHLNPGSREHYVWPS